MYKNFKIKISKRIEDSAIKTDMWNWAFMEFGLVLP